jgi:type VI secretion system ImpA/VasJ family protein
MSTPDAIAARAATLLAPIAGPEPGGQNATYDPRYEAIRTELAKLDAPTGGEVEWKQVTRGCQELLTGTTKDFLLASQLALALLQLERWTGLAVGLATVDGMLENFWEVGFPPVARMRARGNALDWLVARLEIALPGVGVKADEVAAFDATATIWARMAGRARDRLGEFTPGMGGVTEAIDRLRLNIPPELRAAAAAPSPTAEPATTLSPAAAPPPDASAATPSTATPSEPSPAPAPIEPSSPAPAAAAPAAAEPAPAPADPLAEFTAKAEAWLAPIPGANPAGAEARYEPGFEVARLEIAKLESVTDNVVQWKLVHEHASTILRDKSKDLLMATYLAFAKLKQTGLAEFVVGLAVVGGLLDRYWDGMFPERLRGRANALAWLVDQLEKALGEVKLSPKDRPEVLALQAIVSRVATLARDRMASDGPSFGPVNERVQRMLLAVPEEKQAPPPPPPTPTPVAQAAPAPAAAPKPAAAPAVTSVAAPANAEAVVTYLQETGRNLVSAANQLREAAPTNPAAYRLMRVGLYLHLDRSPPSEAGGKTQIPALLPAKRTQLATLEANGKWEALIAESEGSLPTARFCLDLHRYTHRALERLGDAYVAARQAVVAELAAVLARMPDAPDLSARDGTPLCDGDTKTWIAQIVLAGTGAPSGGGADNSGGADDAKVFAEVRGLLTAGKAADAMRIGQACVDTSTTERQRFVRRSSLANALLDAGQAMLARGLFAALERELRERQLFAWEPELSARCLEGFVRAIRAAAKAGARYEQADLVYERLCLVDPTAAARLAT